MLLAASQEDAGRLDDATKTIEGTSEQTDLLPRLSQLSIYTAAEALEGSRRRLPLARKMNPRRTCRGHAAALLNSGEPRQAQDVLQTAMAAAATRIRACCI